MALNASLKDVSVYDPQGAAVTVQSLAGKWTVVQMMRYYG